MEDTELRAGLYPKPPDLSRPGAAPGGGAAAAARQFWIVKHGLKLTGMPAWGTTHDDNSLWALVAFVRKLPHDKDPISPGTNGYGHRHDAESGGHSHAGAEQHSHSH